MHVAVYEAGHDYGVCVCVDVCELRICGSRFLVVAYVEDVTVLYYYESVGIVVVAFLFVVQKAVGLEGNDLASDTLKCCSLGIDWKRCRYH